MGRHFEPPPPQQRNLLFASFSLVVGDLGLDAVFHFDLNAAILGWLLSAVQPKKQHPRHRWLYLCVKTCIFLVVINQVPSQVHFVYL